MQTQKVQAKDVYYPQFPATQCVEYMVPEGGRKLKLEDNDVQLPKPLTEMKPEPKETNTEQK